MADITLVKISALPAAEQIGAEDLLPVVQEGATKAVAYGVIKDDIAEELAPDATLSEAGKAADAKAVGDALVLKADKTELNAAVSRIDAALNTKVNNTTYTAEVERIDGAIATKADAAATTAALATKANANDVTEALALKADAVETSEKFEELTSTMADAIGEVDLAQFFEIGNVNITINGWTYTSGNGTRVNTKEGVTFHLKPGTRIGLRDYTEARYFTGWRDANGEYHIRSWSAADYVVQQEGDYVFTLDSVPAKVQTDLSLAELFFGYQPAALNYAEENTNAVKNLTRLPIESEYGFINDNGTINSGHTNGERITPPYAVKSGMAFNIHYAFPAETRLWATYCLYDANMLPVGKRELLINADRAVVNLKRTITDETARYIRFSFRTYDSEYTFDVFTANPGYVYYMASSAIADQMDIFAWAYNSFINSVNHRGYNTIAPENTIAAFRLSKYNGFNKVETDVRFTSDNVAVLLHDESINRTARNADGTEISETVNIADITYEQALTYDFGIYKGTEYAGTKIVTFAEFIKFCKSFGIEPYIELKVGTQAQIEGLADAVRSYGMSNNVAWIAFSEDLLAYVKERTPAGRFGLLTSELTSDKLARLVALKETDNEVFVDANLNGLTSEQIELCKAAGVPLEVWTINNENTLYGLNDYITGVTSDSLNASFLIYSANK